MISFVQGRLNCFLIKKHKVKVCCSYLWNRSAFVGHLSWNKNFVLCSKSAENLAQLVSIGKRSNDFCLQLCFWHSITLEIAFDYYLIGAQTLGGVMCLWLPSSTSSSVKVRSPWQHVVSICEQGKSSLVSRLQKNIRINIRRNIIKGLEYLNTVDKLFYVKPATWCLKSCDLMTYAFQD